MSLKDTPEVHSSTINLLNVFHCSNVNDCSSVNETKFSTSYIKCRGLVDIVNIVKDDSVSIPCTFVTDSECKLAVSLDHDLCKEKCFHVQ